MEAQSSRPALEVGRRITLDITDVAFGGEGVGRLDEFVVFVPFVLTGERIEAEVTEVKKQFARAKLIEVLEPSPDRVAPPCPYFGDCGGCQYQHVRYERQLAIKGKQIADLFQRIGGFDRSRVEPVIGSPVQYGYRNRIMVRSQWDKIMQGLKVGFIRTDNRLVVDVEQCQIAEPELNEQLKGVRANPPPKGGLKVMLRLLPSDWLVPKDSFFQSNFHLLPKLVETVRDCLRSSGVRFLIDAYCGVGFFALESADLVERYIGIEYDKLAVRAARANAHSRGRENGEFQLGMAESLLPSLSERFPPAQTAVILDPPRKGCHPSTLDLLGQIRPRQIIYVSCHPATLARDLKALCNDGRYELRRVVPLDMFPQTQHVECVGDLAVPAGPIR